MFKLAFRPFRGRPERRKGQVQVGLSAFPGQTGKGERPSSSRSFGLSGAGRKGGKAKSAFRPFGLSAFPLKSSPQKNAGKEERPSSSCPFGLSVTGGKEERP